MGDKPEIAADALTSVKLKKTETAEKNTLPPRRTSRRRRRPKPEQRRANHHPVPGGPTACYGPGKEVCGDVSTQSGGCSSVPCERAATLPLPTMPLPITPCS